VPAAAGTAQPARAPAADALVEARAQTEAARGEQGGRGGGGAARGRRGGGARPQPYDRNKFLQANFRFLVSDAGDLRRWEANADLMPDWEDVVEARPARAACCSGLVARVLGRCVSTRYRCLRGALGSARRPCAAM